MLSKNENEWYNNLSEAGKTAVKLNIILTKALLESKSKERYKKIKDCLAISAFESSENKKNLEDDEDKEEIDIFSISKINKLKTKKNYKKIKNIQKNRKKYKYHDYHIKNLKIKEKQNNPSCTKYNPKYESILKGIKSLPLWEKLTGRIYHKKETFEHKFYLQHENIEDTMAGNTFIDMSKQISKRVFDNSLSSGEYINRTKFSNSNSNININKPFTTMNKINDFKSLSFGVSLYSNTSNNKNKNKKINHEKIIRPTSVFHVKKKIKNNIFYNKTKKFNNISKIDKSTYNNNTTNINSLIDSFNDIDNKINKINKKQEEIKKAEDSDISTDSYDLFKNIYTKKKKRKNELNSYTSNNYNKIKNNYSNKKNKFPNKKKKKINAPDFKKCLSRDSLYKLEEKNFSVVPYLIPNYESVRAKPPMMVVYNRKKHKIIRAKSANLLNLDNKYYKQNIDLDNINNHISVHPPDFNLMNSRPIDNGPLPSYMKKIFDRNNCYNISDYSLKLNNYKNRDFISMKSTFWPKVSFNKVINLNLLKSKKFLNNFIFDEKNELKKQIFGKALKFYNKNYEEIFKEEGLPKFDNVTYKSYDRKININVKDLIKNVKK